jgi:SAM-dependent methyltransferase
MRKSSMKRFWDARAREDPFFFVDNRMTYGDPDLDRFWTEGEEVLDLALEWAEETIGPDDEIVEIGCGVGRVTRALAGRGRSVKAFDVSEQMLHRAGQLNSGLDNVDWILGDGSSLQPLPGNSANVCFSHVVFQHIPDPQVTLGYVREMGRVLRGGGWAVFNISNLAPIHDRPPMRARILAGTRALLGRGPRGQGHPAWRGSAVDLGTLRAAATAGGAVVDSVRGEGTQYCVVVLRKPAAESA